MSTPELMRAVGAWIERRACAVGAHAPHRRARVTSRPTRETRASRVLRNGAPVRLQGCTAAERVRASMCARRRTAAERRSKALCEERLDEISRRMTALRQALKALQPRRR
jgi:hypothetical protein